MTLIGLFGFIYKTNVIITNNAFQGMQIIFHIFCSLSGHTKIIVIIYNSKTIWKLFDVARDSF